MDVCGFFHSDESTQRPIECRVGSTEVTGGRQDLTSTNDLCYSRPDNAAVTLQIEYECPKPVKGRYVVLQKTDDATAWSVEEIFVFVMVSA